jgi:hypothetical protein
MPRALVTQRTTVPAARRKKVFEQMRAKLAYYTGQNCRYWVFEEVDLPGAFIEFVEAADPKTLDAALKAAPKEFSEPWRIYQEISLS